MSDRITKVFEHDDFAIWHVPQANGYVYEAAGIAVDADSYVDCPFESSYDDALNAACELYDVEVGSLSTPLPVVAQRSTSHPSRGQTMRRFADQRWSVSRKDRRTM